MKGFLWGVNVPKQLHCLQLLNSLAKQGRIYGHFGISARMWNYRFIHRRRQFHFSVLSVHGRELWPDFHASTNSCLVYSVLFVLKHIIFTSIVWPFIFRNFIWLNCRNSNCVTLCAMLQSIRCHFQVWTFTCPFNRTNKNPTKNFK